MKLVSLNTWGATRGIEFFEFIKQHAKDVDIFCLQEVFRSSKEAPGIYNNFNLKQLSVLKKMLPDFFACFDPKSFGFADDGNDLARWSVELGSCIFVRKPCSLEHYASHYLLNSAEHGAPPVEGLVKAQVLTLKTPGSRLNIINVHGLSRPGDKTDTEPRLLQSKRILEIMEDLEGEIILCGDFNLMPDTESVKMLEGRLRNLIAEYKVENTRNEISWKKYNNKQSYADFTFVSKNIKVKSFEVPYNLVSDHLPMIMVFTITD